MISTALLITLFHGYIKMYQVSYIGEKAPKNDVKSNNRNIDVVLLDV